MPNSISTGRPLAFRIAGEEKNAALAAVNRFVTAVVALQVG